MKRKYVKPEVKTSESLPGELQLSELPDLSGQPAATCPNCGAIYHARWAWDGSERKGRWVFRSAKDYMDGYPGYLGHRHFCDRATEADRKTAGDNRRKS